MWGLRQGKQTRAPLQWAMLPVAHGLVLDLREKDQASGRPDLCCSPADTKKTHRRKLHPAAKAVVEHPLHVRSDLEESCLRL